MTDLPAAGDAVSGHDVQSSAASAVPVTILTGFLGAGKTTLLNRLLAGEHGLRVAVLVNDFGSLNIDADLVVGVDEREVVSLANGCVCCTVRDDLVEAVATVLDRPETPQHIVLEASGVADPAGIAVTFLDSAQRERLRIDSIMCVVDASEVIAAPEQQQLKLWQVACSDMVVLNKMDLVDAGGLERIKAWLDRHFQRYRLIEAVYGDVPLDVLLATGRFDPAGWGPQHEDTAVHEAYAGHHRGAETVGTRFTTWTYETDQPMSLRLLEKAAARLPAGVYRAKGIVRTAEQPESRAVLQVVGKRVDLALSEAWGGGPRGTRIVVIGAEGAVEGDALRALFDGCRVGSFKLA
jgi:G3E family GTPase